MGCAAVPVGWPEAGGAWLDTTNTLERQNFGVHLTALNNPTFGADLMTLLARYTIGGLTEENIDHLNRAWHRLEPWPDTVPGLTRLGTKYILNPMSNGNVRLLADLARHGGLPFDTILGAEAVQAYKPLPRSYLGNAELLMLEPEDKD